MTTNVERAGAILADWADSEGGLTAIDNDYDGDMAGAAQALADAGLLMPDLPVADEGEWENFGNVISLDGMHILPMIENDALTPDEARDIAYSLLAAADYAEKSEGNA